MRIGRRGLDRSRLAQRVVHRVERPECVTRSPSSSRRMSIAASSSRSSRSPKPAPKSMPKASCSRSNQPPPRPSTARPPETWSSVVASLAIRPGLRNVVDDTSRPSRTRSVRTATAASVAQPSSFGSAQSPSSDEQVVVEPERVPAGPLRRRGTRRAGPASSVRWIQNAAPNRMPAGQSGSEDRKRNTGVAARVGVGEDRRGRSGEYTSSSDSRRPNTTSLYRNRSAIGWSAGKPGGTRLSVLVALDRPELGEEARVLEGRPDAPARHRRWPAGTRRAPACRPCHMPPPT